MLWSLCASSVGFAINCLCLQFSFLRDHFLYWSVVSLRSVLVGFSLNLLHFVFFSRQWLYLRVCVGALCATFFFLGAIRVLVIFAVTLFQVDFFVVALFAVSFFAVPFYFESFAIFRLLIVDILFHFFIVLKRVQLCLFIYVF